MRERFREICQRRGLCHGQRVGVHDRAVFRYRLGDHGAGTWQLVINTATTIITFLMVFLIQATQNRDSKAIQLNLDELLRAITKARTGYWSAWSICPNQKFRNWKRNLRR